MPPAHRLLREPRAAWPWETSAAASAPLATGSAAATTRPHAPVAAASSRRGGTTAACAGARPASARRPSQTSPRTGRTCGIGSPPSNTTSCSSSGAPPQKNNAPARRRAGRLGAPHNSHPEGAAGLAGPLTPPMAEHREPPPADQQPDRHEDQPRQQPLDQRRDARAGRNAGTAPRRTATRRGPHPRARPTPPRRGLRTRREDRAALRRLRPASLWKRPPNRKPVRADSDLLPFCLPCPHEIEDCPGTVPGH